MAAGNFDIKEIEKRMKGAASALKSEFGGLRTGRASTTLLDPLMVNTSYGAKMPILGQKQSSCGRKGDPRIGFRP
jgi:ribosome recycling factor